LRTKVKALIPAFHKLRDLGSSLIPEREASNARDRIIAYLLRYPTRVIDGDELMVVSGIGEWARRTRELRVQFGWWIYTGVTFRQMAEDAPDGPLPKQIKEEIGADPLEIKPDQYVLLRSEQDRDAAYRWNLINSLRKHKGSVKQKILAYLRENVGKQIPGEELRYLAGDASEWARRARELRTEEGWPVVTKNSGRPDLPVGVYFLEADRQSEPHDRKIPDDVRVEVLTRDGFKCVECGWSRKDVTPGDPRQFLELHHVQAHADKGANTADNLITLCNVHHDKVHKDMSRKRK
jgi:hypothetical protein